MNNSIFIFSSISIFVCLVFFLRMAFINYKNTHRTYDKKGDLDCQAKYLKSKNKDDKISFTLKERIDLSWQFLYDITNNILNKFSNSEKSEVVALGKILFDNGMRYEHVVDYGIRDIDLKLQEKKAEKKQAYIG